MKMIIRIFFLFCLTFYGGYSFSQSANVIEGCAPLTVGFTAPAGSTTFFWDFKDGATSPLQNPSNTFLSPGVYVVEFSELVSGPIIGTVTITVYAKPSPNMITTSLTQGCVPLTVTFEDNTTVPNGVTISSYSWTFGDGGSGATSPVSNTYTTPGVYSISLGIITNLLSCNSTNIFTNIVSVTQPPNTIITTSPSPPSSCTAPLTVGFTNGSSSTTPLTYTWDFGNGNTSILENPTPENYTTNGNYIVTLTATDTNNCSNSVSTTVSIGQPTSSFIIPDTVCVNTNVNITNTSSAGVYSWSFGANATPATSALTNPNVQFTATGIYNVTLTTFSLTGGCTHDTTIQVYVEDPQVSFSSIPSYSCFEPVTINYTGNSSSNILTWDWTFGDGSTGSGQSVPHEYVIGDTTYSEHGENILTTTLTVSTVSGCTATFTSTDTIHLPWARFMPDVVNGCAPLSVTFSDSSRSNETITQWEWDFGDGNTSTTANNNPNTHIFTTPGVYDVVLIITNSAGCTDTSDTIRIEVGDLVALNFSANVTSVCPGDTVFFTNLTTDSTNIDAWNYSSEGNRLFNCYQDDNPYWIFNNETGFQDVTLTAEYNGCFSTETKANYIEVKGPVANFNYRLDCSTPMDVLFSDSSSGSTSISWNFGDGTTSTASTVPHTYASTGTYNVILTASNSTSGCSDSKDSVVIHIKDIVSSFTTDSLLCGGISYNYNASPSTDVNPYCNRGYTWIFSDPPMRPLTSSSPTEAITFNTSGPQTIGLIVEDINGCVDTLIQNIIVYNSTANFSVSDSSICIPDTLNFIDLTIADTSIASWSWNLGNGNTSSLQNPSSIYSNVSGSSIPISLTTTDALGCTSTSQFTISIYTPVSFISTNPSPPNVCVGEDINFTASNFTAQGSSLIFNWNFGDGTTSTLQTETHFYSASGTYNVVLSYIENSSGCSGTTIRTVNVQAYPNAGYFTDVDNLSALCSPQAVVFTDTSTIFSNITSQQWDFGSGNIISGANPSFIFTTGTHPIELVVSTSYGCTDTIRDTLIVVGPQGDFTFDKNNICKSESIIFTLINGVDVDSLSWDFGDGSPSSNLSPVSHQYNFLPPSGQTVAKLTIFGPNGSCPVLIDTAIFIHEVRAEFDRNDEIDTVLCLGESLLLTNNSLNSDVYSWTLGDGNTSISSTNFSYTYTVADTFNITLYAENSTFGCKDTIIKPIYIYNGPIITPIGDTVCPSEVALLDAGISNSFYTYLWTPVTSVVNSATSSTQTIPLTTSQYFTISVMDTNNCLAVDSSFVYVFPEIIGFNYDTLVVVGDSVFLPIDNSNGSIIFSWTPIEGLSCINCSNPWVGPLLEDVTYYLTAQDTYGCSTADFIFYIEVLPETLLEVPTTFTPNGDGINDIIYLESWGVKELFEFQIYNRWGELIFETNDINVGWDGYYKGVLQNNDMYVFKARALDWFDKEIYKEGHIHLMR